MARPFLQKIKRAIKPARGSGFSGDGKQRQRSKQIQVMSALFENKMFINNFPELLYCNESRTGVAHKIDVAAFMEDYFKSMQTWMNYPTQIPDLKGWVDSKGNKWPNLHPAHQHVVDTYKTYRPASVCEVGAGAGVVAKYVFAASDQKVKLACVEGSATHLAAMKLNFSGTSDIIAPNIKVNAEVVKAAAQKIPFADNSYELVYTCTLMMHVPYIAAVLAACEMARVSSKYVLHVEGYHTDGIAGFRDKYNLLLLDYERLYHKLGFQTVKKFFYQDPYSTEYDYIVYLAEKI